MPCNVQDAFWKFCKGKNGATLTQTETDQLPALVETFAVQYAQ